MLKVMFRLNEELKREREKLQRLESAVEVTGTRIDGLPKSSVYQSLLENLSVVIMESQARIKTLENVRAACRLELVMIFNKVYSNENLFQAMLYRYCDCLEYHEIANRMNYSVQSIFRFLNEGKTIFESSMRVS